MEAITDLLTDASTLWTAGSILAVTILGFIIGRKLIRKVG